MAAGSIVVDLLMRTGSFETDTKRAEKRLKELEKTAIEAGKMLAGAFTAAAGAAAVLVTKTIASADEIGRFAQLANTSVEGFQKMAFAAKSVGIEQDKLADIFKDTQDKVGDFLQTGGGPLADFFENIAPKVGVTAEQFRTLSGPEALQLYVSSLEKANLSQSDMVFYLEAIASDSALLLPLLQDNGRAMQEMGAQAEKAGAVMSSGLVASSREFQQNLRVLKAQVDGFGVSLANQVVPFLNDMFRELRNVGEGFDLVSLAGEGFKVLMQTVLILGANVAFVLRGIGLELGGLAAQAAALAKLDLSAAREIGRMMREDAATNRAALDDFERRIMGAGTPRGPGGGRGSIIPPLAVPDSRPPSTAPMGGKAAGADAAKKAAQEYDSWLKQFEDATTKRHYEVLEMRARREQEVADERERGMQELLKNIQREEEQFDDWMADIQKGNADRQYKVIDDRLKKEQEAMEKTADFAKDLGMSFTSAFEDAIVGGKSLGEVLKGLEQDIIRIITRKLVTEPLGNMFTSWLGSVIPGMPFGGARAGGGDVISGRAYLVGEDGPEMFVPRTAGAVMPNTSRQQTQRAGNVINVNVTAVQGMTRDTALQQGQRIAQGLQLAMMRNG